MLPTCRYSLSVASFSFLSCRMVSVCSPSEYIVTVCDFHLHCSQREDAEIKTELKYKGLAVACCCLYQYPSPPQMSNSRSEGSKIWEHRCGLLASHILLDLFHSYHPKTNRRRRAVFLSNKGVLSYILDGQWNWQTGTCYKAYKQNLSKEWTLLMFQQTCGQYVLHGEDCSSKTRIWPPEMRRYSTSIHTSAT